MTDFFPTFCSQTGLSDALTKSVRHSFRLTHQFAPQWLGNHILEARIMTYSGLLLSAIVAGLITILAIGSRPATEAASNWPQMDLSKTDRIVTGSVPLR
jgi:hypothetical protein